MDDELRTLLIDCRIELRNNLRNFERHDLYERLNKVLASDVMRSQFKSEQKKPDEVESLKKMIEQLRSDLEHAEQLRDSAKLNSMKSQGQLNTLHKALSSIATDVSDSKDPQSDSLKRIQWLASNGGANPAAAAAARETELEQPVPSRMVLEMVAAGERKFTRDQQEFVIGEAMVLTGWSHTPIELLDRGEPWLANLILEKSPMN